MFFVVLLMSKKEKEKLGCIKLMSVVSDFVSGWTEGPPKRSPDSLKSNFELDDIDNTDINEAK